MLTVLALDLSVKSTGFALHCEGMAKPASGTWALADGVAHAPKAFVRLHRHLRDINDATPIGLIVYEDALPASKLHGHTNLDTLKAAAGLAAHVQSFAEAMGIRYRCVNLTTWRKHFIGSMPRGTKTDDFKFLALKRCNEFGFDVIKHDAAEACGLLDYELSIEGIIPPWRQERVLTEQLAPRSKLSIRA